MLFTLSDHRIEQAQQVPSPNCDDRPDAIDIDLMVIHNISLPPEQYGGGFIQQFFCNTLDCDTHPYFDQLRELRVSSHLLIQRDGSVVQFVPFNKRAWHAGVSHYQGRDNCNDFSIGIELEGCDEAVYESCQYSSLIELIQCLINGYQSLTTDAIVGHSDISPQRKTDPGPAFDWQRLKGGLRCKSD